MIFNRSALPIESQHELRRPWKLVTFAIGLSWLIYGALFYEIGDWDVGVSLIMAGLTYLTAAPSARALWLRKWRKLPLILFWYWFAVDGSYLLWHTALGNPIYREANFYASSALYWLCGFIWFPRCSLAELKNFKNIPL